jgi:hypothetical protein
MAKRKSRVVIDDDDEVVVKGRYVRVFAVIVVVMTFFEFLLWGIGFIFADEVQCNLLWCTFTTIRSARVQESWNTTQISEEHYINIQSHCTKNGVPIDCKLLAEEG